MPGLMARQSRHQWCADETEAKTFGALKDWSLIQYNENGQSHFRQAKSADREKITLIPCEKL